MKKILIVLMILAIALTGCFGACVSDDSVVTAVENQGYTDVEILDKDIVLVGWAGCSDDDAAAYEVKATNSLGKRVNLLVCAGWPFKGVTVRSK